MDKRYRYIENYWGNKPEPMMADAAAPNLERLTAPVLRETMTIMVDGVETIVYKDDIEKQLRSPLYEQLYSGLLGSAT